MSRIVRRVAGTPLDGVRLAPRRRSNFSPRRAVASILQVKRPPEDPWILLPALLLVGLGVLMVFSSSALNSLISTDDAYGMGMRQLLFAAMGVGALAILSSIDYRRWRPFATPVLIGSLALLVLVLIPGVPTEQGLRRSLSVGPISIHAAELAKLALILCLANFFANRGHLMAQQETLYPALAAIGVTFLLVLIAPDLGTATVVAGIGFALFFTAGAPLRWVFGTALMAAAVSVIGISSRSYQAARLNNWLDPFSDPTGGSYQTLQGLIAIATGGIFGTGIGTSQQPGGVIIPYAWNDYIFAVVGEEFGFLGAVVVIGAFIAIALRGLRVARLAPDTFGALLATGIVVWICGQAFLNIGVVLAILPVTGIPLPLLSQGGSSLFVLMCAIGLLLSVSRETMGAQEIGGINARGDRGRRYGGTPLSGPRRSSYAPTSTTRR